MHLRERFSYTQGNKHEEAEALAKWRAMVEEEMPDELLPKIRRVSDAKMLKIMDMMAIRLRHLKDVRNHFYFFTMPDYQTDLGRTFLTKLK